MSAPLKGLFVPFCANGTTIPFCVVACGATRDGSSGVSRKGVELATHPSHRHRRRQRLTIALLSSTMTFDNEKKTFLEKGDRSKKGSIDARVIPILNILNVHPDYYTTSSCSGRVYLWRGSGKKNETEWLKVSHELIDDDFFIIDNADGLVWLRVEPFILHVACRDLAAVHRLLTIVRTQYKKSCLLSLGKKLVIEIRGSEFVEMPLYQDDRMLFSGELSFLTGMVNKKLTAIFSGLERFARLTEIEMKHGSSRILRTL